VLPQINPAQIHLHSNTCETLLHSDKTKFLQERNLLLKLWKIQGYASLIFYLVSFLIYNYIFISHFSQCSRRATSFTSIKVETKSQLGHQQKLLSQGCVVVVWQGGRGFPISVGLTHFTLFQLLSRVLAPDTPLTVLIPNPHHPPFLVQTECSHSDPTCHCILSSGPI